MKNLSDDKDKGTVVEIGELIVNFILYSNYNFMTVDNIVLNEENNLYLPNINTIKGIINMSIAKNLKSINQTLLQSNFDIDLLKLSLEQHF